MAAAQSYIPVSIYGANSNDWNTPQGTQMGFPIQQIVVRQLSAPTAYSGVTCYSQVQLLPTGPSPIQPVYYSAKTTAELVSLINTGS